MAAAGRARTAPTGAQGGAGDDRPEGDGGVEVHGAGGGAGGEQVVLYLLVDDDEPEGEGTVDRVVEQATSTAMAPAR
jgi:hypothetical protein